MASLSELEVDPLPATVMVYRAALPHRSLDLASVRSSKSPLPRDRS